MEGDEEQGSEDPIVYSRQDPGTAILCWKPGILTFAIALRHFWAYEHGLLIEGHYIPPTVI